MSIDFKPYISIINDWPKPGITTYDVGPLLRNPVHFKNIIEELAQPYLDKKITAVVGIEARGFLLAAALAYRLDTGVVLIRKKGKLPPPTIEEEYNYEYASHVIEIQTGAINPGEHVVLIDDILATGGTMSAAVKLVKKLGGEIIGLSFFIYMSLMAGEDRLKGQNINYLINYQ